MNALIKKFRIKSFKKKRALVALNRISLSFGNRRILEDINLNINENSIVGLLGPNGSGKSTLFRIISGELLPDSGSVMFDNINATNIPIYSRTRRFRISYCPQHGGYFHNLSLLDNLNAIGEILIKDANRRNFKINELIAKFELDVVRNVEARFLSGGQKRKLVIAMALLGDPKILLLDEPFSALDLQSISTLQQLIVNLQAERNLGIIVCDHNAESLLRVIDSGYILSNCKIMAQGTPSELIRDDKSHYFPESFKFN